ncbi:hypothetical protein HPB49_024312 [Dermacentor silvarum]|uniref:Uncharacterized protein n=1 Tax=Dermacentor silvarum TaxID=543639 RepID=A0ACB8DH93_DERSI|nr:hypothetical protein HPB49_024312 [Dermacentor silvarum]
MADSAGVLRRNRPGTKAENFSSWPDEPFDEMDSTLAVQQFIQQAIRKDPTNVDEILTPPDGQDEGVWKYEHLRQFCMELNGLAVKLQAECNADSCTQMTATEQWIFLCAAHKTPKECPAIDYTRHTLDGAACLLNSNKYFPSRALNMCLFFYLQKQTCLCRRFTTFVTKYNLMSKDNLIVPILDEELTAGESEA